MAGRLRALALLLVALGLAPLGCETVPYTGRHQIQLVSPDEEAKMGVQSYQEIVGKAPLSTDGQSSAMVQRVGSRIAAVTDLKYQWEFKLIADDKQANAFALPGGKVAVYTGILPITRDEAGLAAVLGHEIGHVLARHGGERLSQQMGVQTTTQVLAGLASSNPATVQLVEALASRRTPRPPLRPENAHVAHRRRDRPGTRGGTEAVDAGVSGEFGPALGKQLPQNGTMTPLLIFAVATYREVDLTGKSRQQVQDSCGIRLVHLGSKFSLEDFPGLLVQRMLGERQ